MGRRLSALILGRDVICTMDRESRDHRPRPIMVPWLLSMGGTLNAWAIRDPECRREFPTIHLGFQEVLLLWLLSVR